MKMLWRPFADQLKQFLGNAPGRANITAGWMNPSEYRDLYHKASGVNRDAAQRLGLPDQSPFLRGRAATIEYPDVATERWAVRNGSRYGIHVDKDYPWLLRPLGDRFRGAGAQKPASASDLLEMALSGLFYDSPEAKYASPEQGVSGGRPGRVNPAEEYMTDVAGEYGEPGRRYTKYNPDRYTVQNWDPDIDALMGAIREQESGGDYDAVGKEVEGQGKAGGAYQFMPESWTEWSTDYNRIFNDAEGELEQTPENQDLVAKWRLGKMMEHNDNNIGVVLATWYGGNRGARRHSAGLEPVDRINTPSIREYVQEVLGRYRNRLSSVPDEGPLY